MSDDQIVLSEKDKMLAGMLYNCLDPVLARERRDCKINCQVFNNTLAPYHDEDQLPYQTILKKLLPNAHESVFLEPPFRCDYGYNIHIGESTYFNVDCVILDVSPVHIGKHVKFAPGVQVYTATHPLDAEERRSDEFSSPVTIGDDCWIGGHAVICPGVTLGDRCVVAAGAVVTKSFPSDSLIAGVPAVLKKKLNVVEEEIAIEGDKEAKCVFC